MEAKCHALIVAQLDLFDEYCSWLHCKGVAREFAFGGMRLSSYVHLAVNSLLSMQSLLHSMIIVKGTQGL